MSTYTKAHNKDWVDGKDGGTPITATALNKIEGQLAEVYNAVLSDSASVATKAEVTKVNNKFSDYTTTETLNTQLSNKADKGEVVTLSEFETFKTENNGYITTEASNAKAEAVSLIENKGYATKTEVANTYATKDALEEVENKIIPTDLSNYYTKGETESVIDDAINTISIPDVSQFVTQDELDAYTPQIDEDSIINSLTSNQNFNTLITNIVKAELLSGEW